VSLNLKEEIDQLEEFFSHIYKEKALLSYVIMLAKMCRLKLETGSVLKIA